MDCTMALVGLYKAEKKKKNLHKKHQKQKRSMLVKRFLSRLAHMLLLLVQKFQQQQQDLSRQWTTQRPLTTQANNPP